MSRYVKYILVIATLVGVGFVTGVSVGSRGTKLAPKGVDPSDYALTLKAIHGKYVRTKFTDAQLYYGQIHGMVESLGDPHSEFLPPAESQLMLTRLAGGNFSGIGAAIGPKDERIVVISPQPGSPSDKAGLEPGDVIVSVDGKELTPSDTITQVVLRIRGPKGSTVHMEIYREGDKDTRKIDIVRDDIAHDPPVSWSETTVQGKKIVVIRLDEFSPEVPALRQRAVQAVAAAHADGVVLDLRYNPGGSLTVAQELVCTWIPKGPVVITEFRDQPPKFDVCNGPAPLFGMPTAVLINKYSASASEITAGALQDYKAARVFGEKSYGKGCGQVVSEFEDGSTLRLTTFLWKTPKGRSIDHVGITPDELVKGERPERITALHPAKPAAIVGATPDAKADPKASPPPAPPTDAVLDRACAWLATGK